jgi:biopolymer transport protein ExbB/TolQ
MSFFDFIKENIGHVLPILLAGAFGIAIIAERLVALYTTYPMHDANAFFERISSLVMTGKMSDATKECDKYPLKPLAKIIKTGLTRSHLPESVIEDGLHIAVSDATQNILKRTSFLATIANVATLLGLLGTIIGLIHSFEAVGHAEAQQKSALLSAGIATAMNATMLGLAVAIPAMIAFSLLVNRSNQLIAEMETSSVKTLDLLKQRFYAAEDGGAEEKSNERE